jgi:hypothetical protein
MNIRTLVSFEDELQKIAGWKAPAAGAALGGALGSIIGADTAGTDKKKSRLKRGLIGGAAGATAGGLGGAGLERLAKNFKVKLLGKDGRLQPSIRPKTRVEKAVKGREDNVIHVGKIEPKKPDTKKAAPKGGTVTSLEEWKKDKHSSVMDYILEG